LIIGMAVLSFNFWFMVRRLDEDSGAMDYFVTWGMFIIVVTVLLVMVYRTLQRPAELRLEKGRILLKGHTLQAEDIRVIMLSGYFSPVIGIKPYGKRIVPVPFCFRFARDEDDSHDDLIKWAKDNEVKLVYKRFIRWL
jgi:Na+/melibiose symporter-like transporter